MLGIYPNIHSHVLSEREFMYVMSAKNRHTRLFVNFQQHFGNDIVSLVTSTLCVLSDDLKKNLSSKRNWVDCGTELPPVWEKNKSWGR